MHPLHHPFQCLLQLLIDCRVWRWNGGQLRPIHYFLSIFCFIVQFSAPSEETAPPIRSTPAAHPLHNNFHCLLLTIGWLLCLKIKLQPPKASALFLLSFYMPLILPPPPGTSEPTVVMTEGGAGEGARQGQGGQHLGAPAVAAIAACCWDQLQWRQQQQGSGECPYFLCTTDFIWNAPFCNKTSFFTCPL
jgi:hypothetical protein